MRIFGIATDVWCVRAAGTFGASVRCMKLLKLVAVAVVATQLAGCIASADEGPNADEGIAGDESSSQESELTGGVPVGTKLTLTTAANLRKQAAGTAAILQVLKAGATVVAAGTSISNGYYEVSYAGVRGFVFAAYLSNGAVAPAQNRVNGLWVAHSSILTEAGIQAVVDTVSTDYRSSAFVQGSCPRH